MDELTCFSIQNPSNHSYIDGESDGDFLKQLDGDGYGYGLPLMLYFYHDFDFQTSLFFYR